MNRFILLLISAVLLCLQCSSQDYMYTAPAEDFSGCRKSMPEKSAGGNPPDISAKLIRYVDPFIGTGGHGHVYPGASLPFGMVQISPDNEFYGWDWCSGYHWFGKKITGFSHKHLSGTGARELGDISFLPSLTGKDRSVSFSHEKEYARPGYYAVKMDNGVLAEFTAGLRSAYHRYSFGGRKGYLTIDLTHDISGRGGSRTVSSFFTKVSSTQLGGCRVSKGWVPVQRVYFFAEFSSPYSMKGSDRNALLSFDADTVIVKVGISSVSVDSARENLHEFDGMNFDAAVSSAGDIWEKELRAFEAKGSEKDKTVFYTAVYHSCLAPNIYSDSDGRFSNPDGSVVKADGIRYSAFSLWDTFRAAHPLYTFTQKNRVNDFIRSMISHYDTHGFLPVWELEGNETNCMIGHHAVSVIAEAYLKGIRSFDAVKAYDACRKTLMQDAGGLKEFRTYGYIPNDTEGESVSKTLEYAYDFRCIARFAAALGKKEDESLFTKYSLNYRNLFDVKLQLMRPKKKDGRWAEPFDPHECSSGTKGPFTEGDAYQWSWSVQHDVDGLTALFGGREIFLRQLKRLFSDDLKPEKERLVDVTGLIGDYAHGNEPSHHIPYLFSMAGDRAETAAIVHRICETLYTDKPDGLCGNEDCGQISAWYIFSAMGFYPVDPVSLRYQLGTPLFDEISMHLDNGRTFTVKAVRTDSSACIPSKITLNGRVIERSCITYDEIISGGTLVFYLRK